MARLIAPPKRNDRLPDDDAGDMPLPADDSGDTPVPAMTPPDAMYLVPGLAAAFLAVNPYQLWYSQEGKMYTVVTALVLLATWFFWRGVTGGGWRPWLGYLLTVTVALYTHLLLILLYPLHLLWFVIAWPLSRRHWLGYGLAMAGLILPYVPMVWWQWDLLTAQQQMTGFSFTPLPEMLRVLLFNHSRGFMPAPALVWLAPIFFLGAAGVVLGPGEIDSRRLRADGRLGAALSPWRRYGLLITWLLAPVLLIYALSLRQPIFTDRYVIWIAPAAMIFMALGVQAVWRHAGAAPRYLAAGLAVYVLVFWAYGGWQQKTLPMKYDLRSGVGYVSERRTPDSLLILQIPHLEYAMRYYSSDFGPRPFTGSEARLGRWAQGLWTNNGWEDDPARALADQQMRAMTAGAPDVWVLRSEVEMWDQRHLMEQWLGRARYAAGRGRFPRRTGAALRAGAVARPRRRYVSIRRVALERQQCLQREHALPLLLGLRPLLRVGVAPRPHGQPGTVLVLRLESDSPGWRLTASSRPERNGDAGSGAACSGRKPYPCHCAGSVTTRVGSRRRRCAIISSRKQQAGYSHSTVAGSRGNHAFRTRPAPAYGPESLPRAKCAVPTASTVGSRTGLPALRQ